MLLGVVVANYGVKNNRTQVSREFLLDLEIKRALEKVVFRAFFCFFPIILDRLEKFRHLERKWEHAFFHSTKQVVYTGKTSSPCIF